MLTQTPKLFKKKTVIKVFVVLFLISNVSPLSSEAALSTDSNYSIEMNDIDASVPEATPKPKVFPSQLRRAAPRMINIPDITPTYTINASNDAFSFKLGQRTIDFGALTATNPVIRTSDITFSTPLYGAQIIGYENHPLMNADKTILPDTTCDDGICTQSIPSDWENDLTYGFGYACQTGSKNACSEANDAINSFQQFADVSAKESTQPIILNEQAKPSTTAQITYKVNISGTQQPSGYSNIVTYIAIPNF